MRGAKGLGLLWMAAWLVMGMGLASSALQAAERPNIVLIVADDLGWADLGCYGSRYHRTPHLDQLASEGLRFTQAYAACPVCSPTRAALLTGKWPARLHLTDWLPGRPDRPDQRLKRPEIHQHLPLEEITLAEMLREAGYETAHIGKWHLGDEGFLPQNHGFDLNIAGDQTGTPLSYFAPYERNGRFMPGLEMAEEGEYLTDRLAEEAVKFLKAPREKPFFLYLPHYAVHTPMKAKEALVAKYAQSAGPAGQQNNPIYAAMLESVDEAVGKVLRALQQNGLEDNTLVLFTSDNGGLATREGPNTPATMNTPLREGKGWLYEGGIRVPLIARWPGKISAGKVTPAVVSSVDLLPTLAQLCEIPAPPANDGTSLVGVLTGQAELLTRDALYWHYPHYSNQGGKPGSAIRKGNYKLIEFAENNRRELYDLDKDSREVQNLADRMPDVVTQLATDLDAWRTSVDAQLMTPNPDYLPNPPAKNGVLELHARTADVHGAMLRYEPLPHKNTLGFWTRPDDWASWELTIDSPGAYRVEGLIGCGDKSGGSQVAFEVAGQQLTYTVKETGGFQNFVATPLGQVKFPKAGRYTLTVKALSKPGPAVMDLRQLTLTPE